MYFSKDAKAAKAALLENPDQQPPASVSKTQRMIDAEKERAKKAIEEQLMQAESKVGCFDW